MKKIIVLCSVILLISGTPIKTKDNYNTEPIEDSIKIEIDTVQKRVHQLDSVLKELKKETDEKLY